jgi:hypothetical protein
MKRKPLDLTTLNLGEVEFFEEYTGSDIGDFMTGKVANIKCTLATIVIQERRTNPHYSLDDARKLKIMDLEFEDAADPTEAEEKPKAKTRKPAAS